MPSYFQTWDGRENRKQVLRLLQYLPVESSLLTDLLLPLEQVILDDSIDSRTDLLDFYSALIGQWSIKLRNQPSNSDESSPFSQLVTHAELLASSIQEFAPNEDDTQAPNSSILSVLRFYTGLTDVFSYASTNARFRIKIPTAATVYTLALIPSISIISTLSAILAEYKSAFETSLASEALKASNPDEPLYDNELVGHFNGYVMDMCNLLWRNRAFNPEDPNAMGCLMPQAGVGALTNYVRAVNEAARHYDRDSAFHVTLPSIFSLSHHVAFCNFSAACFADLEKDQKIPGHHPKLRKPVTQKALQALEKDGGAKVTWQEYRIQMLDWLDAIGSQGTGSLMRSTMKALRKD